MNYQTIVSIGLAISVTVLLSACSPSWADDAKPDAKKAATIGKIERFDPRFDELIPKDAVIEKLTDGYKWTEGPVWIPQRKCILFSDIPNNAIMEWSEQAGARQFMKPAGYTGSSPRGGESGTNGLTLDRDGHLVMCQHGDRRIVRVEDDGRWTTLADKYDGKRFNSPNDLVFKSNGDLYFTDPPYGLEKGPDDPARELAFCGVYRLTADGKLSLLTDQLTRPNGIGFSPDEKTLYVSQSDPDKAVWMAYPIKADGSIGQGKVFFDSTDWVKKRIPGLPDGLKIDKRGNLFATGPGGLNVFAPDGTLLGRLNTGVPTSNCRFGDDGSTLYITANTSLCRIRTGTKGAEF
jgi:gluconolactonase